MRTPSPETIEQSSIVSDSVDSYGSLRAWYALIIFEIQALAAGIDISIITLLVHPIETALRINDVGYAAFTAVPIAIGFAAAYYPAGLLADTFRRRDTIAAACAVWAIAAVVASRADSGPLLFLARLLAGIGSGMPFPAIFSAISDAFPRTRRAFAISMYSAGSALGTGIGLAICGFLVDATQHRGILHFNGILFVPWQQCFIAVAATGAIVLALVFTVTEPPRKDRAAQRASGFGSTLGIFGKYLRQQKLLWGLLFFACILGPMSIAASNTWGPAFGMRHYGAVGAASISILGVFIAIGSFGGSVIGGLLAQRGINKGNPRVLTRMLVIVTILGCICAVGFPFAPSWFVAAAGIGGVNAAWITTALLIQIGIQETAPNEVRGQLIGVWGFISFIPNITGATTVAFLSSGVFAHAGGLGPAMAVVGGLGCMLASVLFAFSGRPYERAMHQMRALSQWF